MRACYVIITLSSSIFNVLSEFFDNYTKRFPSTFKELRRNIKTFNVFTIAKKMNNIITKPNHPSFYLESNKSRIQYGVWTNKPHRNKMSSWPYTIRWTRYSSDVSQSLSNCYRAGMAKPWLSSQTRMRLAFFRKM